MNNIKIESAEVDDLVRGFQYDKTAGIHRCLFCETAFEDGVVYPSGAQFLQANRAAVEHVESAHGGALEALMDLGDDAAGLPEVQAKVLRLLYEGMGDAAIAKALGGKSASTVRNHRFLLRRRQAEARVFLALMKLLDSKGEGVGRFIEYPDAMPSRDDRSLVSPAEAAKIEAHYLSPAATPDSGEPAGPSLTMLAWPKKQKEKLVLLRRISTLFETGRIYSEREINAVLLPVWDDYVTIRRYLIEYRFLDRKPDGSAYWKT